MGGKTSNASIAKYKAKAYDRAELLLPKGAKEKIKVHAEVQGKSFNTYVNDLIRNDMGEALTAPTSDGNED